MLLSVSGLRSTSVVVYTVVQRFRIRRQRRLVLNFPPKTHDIYCTLYGRFWALGR